MLSYEKHKATVIPNTMQRFHFHLSKAEVVDGLTDSIVKTKNGLWELPNTSYPSDLTLDELYLLVKKPLFINSDDFFKSFRTNRIRLIAKPNTNPASIS